MIRVASFHGRPGRIVNHATWMVGGPRFDAARRMPLEYRPDDDPGAVRERWMAMDPGQQSSHARREFALNQPNERFREPQTIGCSKSCGA